MNLIRSFKCWLVLALTLCSTSSALGIQDSEKATLAWKFEKGDVLSVKFEQAQNVLTRIDARDRTLESELILIVGWNVIAVAGNGDATIEQSIERIRIKTGTPGEEIKNLVDVDTASDLKLRGISRDVMKQVKTLLGLKFSVVVSPAGKIISMTPAGNVAAVVDALPETSALRRVFSAAGMARLVGESAFVLPSMAVGKGDSWSDNSTFAMTANDGSKLSFGRNVNSTVNAIDDKKASIDVEVTLSQKPIIAAPLSTALTSPLELQSFTGGGNLSFDLFTGTITFSTISSEMKTRVIYRKEWVKSTTSVTNKMTVTRK